jgi:mxaJ protein
MVREAVRDCAVIAAVAAAVVGAARLFPPQRHLERPAGRIVVPSQEPTPTPADPSVLRVCADPNNLPFSNERQQGFENAIAGIAAAELGKRVEYYWQPQRRGFFRTTLNAGWCDVVIGVPARFGMAATTRPYYRSTYVFIDRRDRGPRIRSLDDPHLRQARIGVEMTGEDYENPPALQALASRHLIDNLRGYLVYGDYSQPDPPRRIVDAVAAGEVDTAIAWGPLAGYFARQSRVPLDIGPVQPQRDGPALSFAFDIAMGVRRQDRRLREALDRVIEKRAADIRAVLVQYGVPLLPIAEP